MATIDDYFGGVEESGSAIEELRLGTEPAMLILFAANVTPVRLHWESDESVKAYIKCPGPRCPHCHLGSKPTDYLLLPVYDIEARQVRALRIPVTRGPGRLGSLLAPHLRDSSISNKVLLISRDGMKYTVSSRPLADGADRGTAAIKAFVDAAPDLTSAFLAPTPEELADIPRVANKLDAIGGLPPAEED